MSAEVTRSQWLMPTVPDNVVLKFLRHVASVLTLWTIPSVQGATAPEGPRPPRCRGFTITLRHTTVVRTPLDEWSARSRDLYPTTHKAHKRQRDSNPQFQQSSGRRSTPKTTRPLRLALDTNIHLNCVYKSSIYLTENTLYIYYKDQLVNPLNAELNPICHLLALLGAHHILHVSSIRVNMV